MPSEDLFGQTYSDVNIINHSNSNIPQNSVMAIERDFLGYFWIGTQSGIARYDGSRFSKIVDLRLESEEVLRIKSYDGNLLISTADYIFDYDIKSDSVVSRYKISHLNKKGDFFFVNGTFWVPARTGVLFYYDFKSKSFRPTRIREEVLDIQETDSIVFAISKKRKIFRIERGKSEYSYPDVSPVGATKFLKKVYVIDSSGSVFIFDKNKFIRTEWNLGQIDELVYFGFYGNEPIVVTENKILSVGKRFKNTPSSSSDFKCGYADKEYLCVGLWTDGLYITSKSSETINSFGFNENGTNGNISLPSKVVWAIQEVSPNELLIGLQKGLFFLNSLSGSVSSVDEFPKGVPVHSIARIKDTYFIGVGENKQTINTYLFQLVHHKKSWKLKPIHLNIKLTGINRIFQVAEDTIYFTSKDSLYCLDLITLKVFRSIHTGRPVSCITHVNGEMWAGTLGNGIISSTDFSLKEGEYGIPIKDPNINTVTSMSRVKDNDSILLIGTNSRGLVKYNCLTKKVEWRSVDEIKETSTINCIIHDSFGYHWISTNKGVYRYNYSKNELLDFNLDQKMKNEEFNSNSGTLGESGMIYEGGINGIYFFDPKKLINHRWANKVYIHEILFPQRSNSKLDSKVYKPYPKTDTDSSIIYKPLKINYELKPVKIRLGDLDFNKGSPNKYIITTRRHSRWFGDKTSITYHNNLDPFIFTFSAMEDPWLLLGGREYTIEFSTSKYKTNNCKTTLKIFIEPDFIVVTSTILFIVVLLTVLFFLNRFKARNTKLKKIRRSVSDNIEVLHSVNESKELINLCRNFLAEWFFDVRIYKIDDIKNVFISPHSEKLSLHLSIEGAGILGQINELNIRIDSNQLKSRFQVAYSNVLIRGLSDSLLKVTSAEDLDIFALITCKYTKSRKPFLGPSKRYMPPISVESEFEKFFEVFSRKYINLRTEELSNSINTLIRNVNDKIKNDEFLNKVQIELMKSVDHKVVTVKIEPRNLDSESSFEPIKNPNSSLFFDDNRSIRLMATPQGSTTFNVFFIEYLSSCAQKIGESHLERRFTSNLKTLVNPFKIVEYSTESINKHITPLFKAIKSYLGSSNVTVWIKDLDSEQHEFIYTQKFSTASIKGLCKSFGKNFIGINTINETKELRNGIKIFSGTNIDSISMIPFSKFILDDSFKSLIYLPVLLERSVGSSTGLVEQVGFVNIYSKCKVEKLADEDNDFLRLISNKMARYFQYKKLLILNDPLPFNKTKTKHEVMREICLEVRKVLFADIVTFFWYDTESGKNNYSKDFSVNGSLRNSELLFREHSKDREKKNKLIDEYCFNKDNIDSNGLIWIHGKPEYLRRIGKRLTNSQNSDSIYKDRFFFRERVSTLIIIPLVIERERKGVVFVNYRKPVSESEELIYLIKSLSVKTERLIISFEQLTHFEKRSIRANRLYKEEAEKTAKLNKEQLELMESFSNYEQFYIIQGISHDIRKVLDSQGRALSKINQSAPRLTSIEQRLVKQEVNRVEKNADRIRALLGLFNLDPEGDKIESFKIDKTVDDLKKILIPIDINNDYDVKLNFTTKIEKDIPKIEGPKLRFSMTMYNLISNAKEATFENPDVEDHVVEVMGSFKDNCYSILVRDNGLGLKTELAKAIRLGESTKEEGLGIGLFFAHKVITEDFSGELRYFRKNKFTNFELTIPKLW